MKKRNATVLLAVILGCTLLLTGCGSEKEKVMTCTRTLNQNGIAMDLKYEATYTGDTVTKLVSTEKITSDDATTLETTKTALEQTYEAYKDVKYYNVDISIDGNTLTSRVTIEADKLKPEDITSIDSANAQLFKDGKMSVEVLENTYTALGASCTKKDK